MPGIGFKDRSIATTLKQMALERKTKAQNTPRLEELSYRSLELKTYIVILDNPLPAATYNETLNEWDLGVGTATVWRLNTDNNDNISSDTDYSIASTKLIPHRDADNNCVRYRVFNCLTSIVNACAPIPVIQDVFGDLYITEVSEYDTYPAPGTTTTSTTMPPCDTRCRWIWSGNVWVNALDCAGATTSTTTSSTTTSSSTTTTTSSSTTTTTTSSSTTSSSTTTTTTSSSTT